MACSGACASFSVDSLTGWTQTNTSGARGCCSCTVSYSSSRFSASAGESRSSRCGTSIGSRCRGFSSFTSYSSRTRSYSGGSSSSFARTGSCSSSWASHGLWRSKRPGWVSNHFFTDSRRSINSGGRSMYNASPCKRSRSKDLSKSDHRWYFRSRSETNAKSAPSVRQSIANCSSRSKSTFRGGYVSHCRKGQTSSTCGGPVHGLTNTCSFFGKSRSWCRSIAAQNFGKRQS